MLLKATAKKQIKNKGKQMNNNKMNTNLAHPRKELLYTKYTLSKSPNTFVELSYIFNSMTLENMQDGDKDLIMQKIKALDSTQVLYVKDLVYVAPNCVPKIINDINAEVEIVPDRLYSCLELEILLQSRGLYSSEICTKAEKNIVKLLAKGFYQPDTFDLSTLEFRKNREFYQYLGASILDFIDKEKAVKPQSIFTFLKNAVIKLFKD